MSSLDVADGRRVALADGDEIFIPKLDLEELVSEGSENFGGPRQRDPRSFDFNQSLDQVRGRPFMTSRLYGRGLENLSKLNKREDMGGGSKVVRN